MRRDFIQHLHRLAGKYYVQEVGTTWHDIDNIEDEFTDEEGFTVTIKKNQIKYTKDFFGKECMKKIPKALLKDNPDLTIEEYNAERILEEMDIK